MVDKYYVKINSFMKDVKKLARIEGIITLATAGLILLATLYFFIIDTNAISNTTATNENAGTNEQLSVGLGKAFQLVFMIIGFIVACVQAGIMLILGVVGLFSTYFYNHYVAKKLFPEYAEEQFLMMYGMLTGTASTGTILLREIDGDFETRAAIRGSGTTLKPGLNINAEDNLALAA